MEFVLLGWPDDSHPLYLDHEQFAYAGKFVMTSTGKAVVGDDGPVAAAAFDEDRTDPSTLVVRYVTVRRDRKGERLGSRLLRFVREHATGREYDRLTINVNNPYSYQAAYRAGFGFTGEEGGIAELTLEWPGKRETERYRNGLAVFEQRELTPAEERFLAEKREGGPPDVVDSPV